VLQLRVVAGFSASKRRNYTAAILAREIVRDAASALGAHSIACMPLKGVVFQQVLYADPAERSLSDVDLLVPEEQFERAIQVLLRAGFRAPTERSSSIEIPLRSPRGLDLDLHRRLFSAGRYRLATGDLFERSRRDEELFGVPVRLADPLDTAAHLIGKFASDHVTDEALPRLRELARWIAHYRIEPDGLARHVESCGLARAARHTFGVAAGQLEDVFFPEALAALRSDPLGRACVRAAGVLLPLLRGTSLAALPAHLLNASLPRAGASSLLAILNRRAR
jgi:hypothetical protein